MLMLVPVTIPGISVMEVQTCADPCGSHRLQGRHSAALRYICLPGIRSGAAGAGSIAPRAQVASGLNVRNSRVELVDA
jgi:hypothetical protein